MKLLKTKLNSGVIIILMLLSFMFNSGFFGGCDDSGSGNGGYTPNYNVALELEGPISINSNTLSVAAAPGYNGGIRKNIDFSDGNFFGSVIDTDTNSEMAKIMFVNNGQNTIYKSTLSLLNWSGRSLMVVIGEVKTGRIILRNFFGRLPKQETLPDLNILEKVRVIGIPINPATTAKSLLAIEKKESVKDISTSFFAVATSEVQPDKTVTKEFLETGTVADQQLISILGGKQVIEQLALAVQTIANVTVSDVKVEESVIPKNISTATEVLNSFVSVLKTAEQNQNLKNFIDQNNLSKQVEINVGNGSTVKIDIQADTQEIQKVMEIKSLATVADPEIIPAGGTFNDSKEILIICQTPGANIRYTLDGSDPLHFGAIYDGLPFTLTQNVKIRAVAFKTDMAVSGEKSADFIILRNDNILLPPVFSIGGGEFKTAKILILSAGTPDSIIKYTTDKTVPGIDNGYVYNTPLILRNDVTIKAIALKDGFTPSAVVENTYTFNQTAEVVATPVFSAENIDAYTKRITITTTTENALIKYTDNGLMPQSGNCYVYGGPFVINKTTTLKAIAEKSGMISSEIAVISYFIKLVPQEVSKLELKFSKNDYIAGEEITGEIKAYDILGRVLTSDSTTSINLENENFEFYSDQKFDLSSKQSGKIKLTIKNGVISFYAKTKKAVEAAQLKFGTDSVNLALSTVIKINPSPAIARFELSIPDASKLSTDVISGKIKAYDEFGNAVTTDNSTVVNVSMDGGIFNFYKDQNCNENEKVQQYTLKNGTADYYLKSVKAGSHKISVSSGSVASLSGDIKTIPGAISKYIISKSTEETKISASFTGKITALDAFDNQVSGDSQTQVEIKADNNGVYFYETAGSEQPFSDKAKYTLKNGEADYYAKSQNAGSIKITVVDAMQKSGELNVNILTDKIKNPSFSVAAGTYDSTQTVELRCQTPNVTIYYTLDGSDPVNSNTRIKYQVPVEIKKTAVIKAAAVSGNPGWLNSDVASSEYIMTPGSVIIANGVPNNKLVVSKGENILSDMFKVNVTLENIKLKSLELKADGKMYYYLKNLKLMYSADNVISADDVQINNVLVNAAEPPQSGEWPLINKISFSNLDFEIKMNSAGFIYLKGQIADTVTNAEELKISVLENAAAFEGIRTERTQLVSTGAATGTKISSDILAPSLVSAELAGSSQVILTLSKNALVEDITKQNDGGFSIEKQGEPLTKYAVSSISKGSDFNKVILNTSVEMTSAKYAGLKIIYLKSGNGTLKDSLGNLTENSSVNINKWENIPPAANNLYISHYDSKVHYSASVNGAAENTGQKIYLKLKNGSGEYSYKMKNSFANNNAGEIIFNQENFDALNGGAFTINVNDEIYYAIEKEGLMSSYTADGTIPAAPVNGVAANNFFVKANENKIYVKTADPLKINKVTYENGSIVSSVEIPVNNSADVVINVPFDSNNPVVLCYTELSGNISAKTGYSLKSKPLNGTQNPGDFIVKANENKVILKGGSALNGYKAAYSLDNGVNYTVSANSFPAGGDLVIENIAFTNLSQLKIVLTDLKGNYSFASDAYSNFSKPLNGNDSDGKFYVEGHLSDIVVKNSGGLLAGGKAHIVLEGGSQPISGSFSNSTDLVVSVNNGTGVNGKIAAGDRYKLCLEDSKGNTTFYSEVVSLPASPELVYVKGESGKNSNNYISSNSTSGPVVSVTSPASMTGPYIVFAEIINGSDANVRAGNKNGGIAVNSSGAVVTDVIMADSSSFAEGIYRVNAYFKNNAGNTSVVKAGTDCVIDKTQPEVNYALSSSYDKNGNGKLDRIIVKFTENIDGLTKNNGEWKLTDALDNSLTLANPSYVLNQAGDELTVDFDDSAVYTGITKLRYVRGALQETIRDAAGNSLKIDASSSNVLDKAKPVLVSWSLNMLPDADSKNIWLGFSETVTPENLNIAKITFADTLNASVSFSLPIAVAKTSSTVNSIPGVKLSALGYDAVNNLNSVISASSSGARTIAGAVKNDVKIILQSGAFKDAGENQCAEITAENGVKPSEFILDNAAPEVKSIVADQTGKKHAVTYSDYMNISSVLDSSNYELDAWYGSTHQIDAVAGYDKALCGVSYLTGTAPSSADNYLSVKTTVKDYSGNALNANKSTGYWTSGSWSAAGVPPVPVVSAGSISASQYLKSGLESTSTVKMSMPGVIYMIKNGVAATTQAAIDNAITNKTAFIAKAGALANTDYKVTVPASNLITEGNYNIIGVGTNGKVSTIASGWLTIDNTKPTALSSTNVMETLKNGAQSNSTVQMDETGSIYLVKNGVNPSNKNDIETAVTAKTAFCVKSDALTNSGYKVTAPGKDVLENELYDIIAVDRAGNLSDALFGLFAIDNDVPVAGNSGILTFDTITGTSVNVKWTKATDTFGEVTDLKYLVYYSASNNIGTISDCEANGTPFGAYTADIASKNVTGLTDSKTYYFNVIVKDKAENKAIYTANSKATLDVTKPLAGNSGTLAAFSGVTATGVTVNWTKGTDNLSTAANLQYLVYYSTSNNIDTVANCKANGTAVGAYAADINTKGVTGLTNGTKYYFNVMIKDEAGNETVYVTGNQTTLDNTAPAPGNSGTLAAFSGVTATGVTVNWTKGTDNLSTAANLQYLVYYSTSNNIDTVANCKANGTAVGAYAADINTKGVTGLTNGTKYYFNVMIKDEAGNEAIYVTGNQTTLDNTAPVPGNSGTLAAFSGVTATGVTVNWTKGTDNLSTAANLQYLVYYSTGNNIDTVANCKANGTAAGVYAADINTKGVTGLTNGTKYYFNVMIKDEAGNEAIYVTGNQTTLDNTAPVPGNSGTLAAFSGVSATGVTVNWTKGTDNLSTAANLQYLVYYSTSNNINTVANCKANGTAVGAYAADINTKGVTGLTNGTKYYFNVMIKDEAGNEAVYVTGNQTTLDNTAPVPGNSGTLAAFSGVTATGVTVNWTKGTDNLSTAANLQYLVYYSTSNNINTVANCKANGTVVGAYASDINTKAVSGLTANTTYYFNVMIKDEAGNEAIYTTGSQATLENTPPTPGNSGTLAAFSGVSSTGITVNWTKGTDNVTAAANLQYLVYYSTSNNIGTVANCKANGTVSGAYATDINTKAVSGLTGGTTYYFNVMIKDAAGNEAVYTAASQATSAAFPASGNIIARWKFENDKNDNSGNNYNFDSGTCTYNTANKKEGSYSLYLNNQAIGNNNVPAAPSSYTVAFWAKSPSNGALYCWNDLLLVVSANNLILEESLSNKYNTNSSFADGAWHHVVMTVNTTGSYAGKVNVYFDGTNVMTDQAVVMGYTSNFYLGCDAQGDYTNITTAYIDDFIIFNKCLSAAEVTSLYGAY